MIKLLFLLTVACALPAFAQDKKQEDSVRAFYSETDAAWSKKDIKLLAAQFSDDAVWIRADGRVLKGRGEILASMEADFSSGRLGVSAKNSPTMFRWIDKNTVLVDVDIEVQTGKPENPTLKFHSVNLMVKQGKGWLIRDGRGYAFLPPRPPPK